MMAQCHYPFLSSRSLLAAPSSQYPSHRTLVEPVFAESQPALGVQLVAETGAATEAVAQAVAVAARPAETAPIEEVVIAAAAALSLYKEHSDLTMAAGAARGQLPAMGTTRVSATALGKDVLAWVPW